MINDILTSPRLREDPTPHASGPYFAHGPSGRIIWWTVLDTSTSNSHLPSLFNRYGLDTVQHAIKTIVFSIQAVKRSGPHGFCNILKVDASVFETDGQQIMGLDEEGIVRFIGTASEIVMPVCGMPDIVSGMSFEDILWIHVIQSGCAIDDHGRFRSEAERRRMWQENPNRLRPLGYVGWPTFVAPHPISGAPMLVFGMVGTSHGAIVEKLMPNFS